MCRLPEAVLGGVTIVPLADSTMMIGAGFAFLVNKWSIECFIQEVFNISLAFSVSTDTAIPVSIRVSRVFLRSIKLRFE